MACMRYRKIQRYVKTDKTSVSNIVILLGDKDA